MALLGSFARFRVAVEPNRTSPVLRHQHALGTGRRSAFTLQCLRFDGGCRIVYRPSNGRRSVSRKRSGICSCYGLTRDLLCSMHWGSAYREERELKPADRVSYALYKSFAGMAGSQLASSAFTLGTAAVLPFYSLMVFAPKSQITKKAMDSNVPYVSLGILYAYLLYLSWTPDTIRLMFASEYWLPELPGIARLFSSETTLASAWIHLLVVDLFAARHIYRDGLDNGVETRHSVSLCLLVCPIGILAHTITKALTTTRAKSSEHNL